MKVIINVVIISAALLIASCDNPTAPEKSNTDSEPLKTVPHKSPDAIGSYLSGTWDHKGTAFTKGATFTFDNVKKTGKIGRGRTMYAKFFQRGSAEIISLVDSLTDNLGDSYIVTREGPRNMVLSNIQTGKVPPLTLKIRSGPNRPRCIPFVKVK